MTEIIIAIPDDFLQMTQHGLQLAILRIPRRVRKAFSENVMYTWGGEAKDYQGRRLVLVKMTDLSSSP